MNLKLSFSLIGLVVFALPMFINVAYVLFPPVGEVSSSVETTQWIEIVEKVSRIGYLVAITFLISKVAINWQSPWLYLAVVFLLLYHIVWIRYFINGRNAVLLGTPFLFVPIPLAIFPVLYFLCAAIWLHNFPATVLMLIFGAAHLTISLQSFH